MINMMYNNNSIRGMNNIGINQIGINNQQNLNNGMQMNLSNQNINNIIESYERKIKMLEDLIKQKDLEIFNLKQILTNNNFNNMNMNQLNMMNMDNPMNISMPIVKPIFNNKGLEIYLKVKIDTNEFDFSCYQRDKVSILKKKFNNVKGDFVYNFKSLDPELTFEDNGIEDNSTIEIKPIINLIFKYSENKISLTLSEDCPLEFAIYYYLIKYLMIKGNPYVIKNILEHKTYFKFLYNSEYLNKNDQTPIKEIFKYWTNNITVLSN